MKKYIFLAAALIVMGCGMTSCSNEADTVEQNVQEPKVTKLVFNVANDAQTRALWDGYTPVFEDGEYVSLFSENNNNVQLTAHVDGSTVTLEGEGTAGDANLYFVYPYCSTATMADGKITSTDDESVYNYLLSGYGPMSREIGVNKYPANALCLAKSVDGGETALSFKGLMAILHFTPLSDYIGSLSVFGGVGQTPCGQMTINVSSSSIEYAENDSKLWCPNAAKSFSFTTGNDYYIALPAFSSTDETVIGMMDSEYIDHTFYTKNPGITFEAGKIYNLSSPASTVPVTAINFDYASLDLKLDEDLTLTPEVLPNDATDNTLTWSSDKESVATVVDGVVTAVGVGTANITATANDGSGVTTTIPVTVRPGQVVFDKNNSNVEWTGSRTSTLRATDSKSGITLTLTRSNGDINRASLGAISFQSPAADDELTVSVTGRTIVSVTNSATSKKLEGTGPWTLTYKTTPSNGWYTSGGDAFIGTNIPSTAKLTVVYQ